MDNDLARLLAEATFFPGLNVRLAALKPLVELAENQLDVARAAAIAHVRVEHVRKGQQLHDEDQTFDLFELEQQVTHLLPKLTRGGLVLTIWSTFERSVKDIAFRVGSHTYKPLPRDYFRSHFLSKAETVFQSHCSGLIAFPNVQQLAQLKFLLSVRNTLIHHDGRLNEAPSNVASLGLQELAAAGIQIERDFDFTYIVPTEEFTQASATLVYTYVHELAARVFNSLVPLE